MSKPAKTSLPEGFDESMLIKAPDNVRPLFKEQIALGEQSPFLARGDVDGFLDRQFTYDDQPWMSYVLPERDLKAELEILGMVFPKTEITFGGDYRNGPVFVDGRRYDPPTAR